jgi:hypothetical protein
MLVKVIGIEEKVLLLPFLTFFLLGKMKEMEMNFDY